MPMSTFTNGGTKAVGIPPFVAILATGGTIAGLANRHGSIVDYQPGTLDVASLLEAMPGLRNYARFDCEQIANLGSQHMTEAIWLRLAKAMNLAMGNSEVNGVVVLHGTDTLEETAYFLDLVATGDKPVVVTGALRPADAVSADGPLNILDAVRLAGCQDARGQGALVALNGRIHAARDVTKGDSLDVAAFQSPERGALGRMVDGTPVFYRKAMRRRANGPRFRLSGLKELPRVEIIYGHVGQRRDLADAAVAAGAKGIVHAGTGMGHVHEAVKPALAEASAKGVRVVCATRVPGGRIPLSDDYLRDGFISAGDLNPQKARVLLQLALTMTDDVESIREMFEVF